MKNKISLIGMPSVGKTTIGKALAKQLGYIHVDLDSMVEKKEGQSLIEVLNEKGGKYFLDMEYAFLQELLPDQKVVISTAGSMIYHDLAMKWLKENTAICFIETSFEIIEQRLKAEPKAIVGLKEKGLQVLWDERIPVYKEWADMTVSALGKNSDDVAREIMSKLL